MEVTQKIFDQAKDVDVVKLFLGIIKCSLLEAPDAQLQELVPHIAPEDVKESSEYLKIVSRQITLGYLQEDQIINAASEFKFKSKFPWINPAKAQIIFRMIVGMKQMIRKSVILEDLQQVHHMEDFDYNIKLSVASNKKMDLKEPLLSLFLYTKTAEGDRKKLHLELNTEEVEEVINLLSEAKKRLIKFHQS